MLRQIPFQGIHARNQFSTGPTWHHRKWLRTMATHSHIVVESPETGYLMPIWKPPQLFQGCKPPQVHIVEGNHNEMNQPLQSNHLHPRSTKPRATATEALGKGHGQRKDCGTHRCTMPLYRKGTSQMPSIVSPSCQHPAR